jgi:hypothetical protein
MYGAQECVPTKRAFVTRRLHRDDARITLLYGVFYCEPGIPWELYTCLIRSPAITEAMPAGRRQGRAGGVVFALYKWEEGCDRVASARPGTPAARRARAPRCSENTFQGLQEIRRRRAAFASTRVGKTTYLAPELISEEAVELLCFLRRRSVASSMRILTSQLLKAPSLLNRGGFREAVRRQFLTASSASWAQLRMRWAMK